MKKSKIVKNKCGQLVITKEMFVKIINSIKKQHELDNNCNVAFGTILPNDYVTGYDYELISNELMSLIKNAFNDNHKDSWIDYFIYDLEFGCKYKEGMITHKDGRFIDLSTSEKLYDFLFENSEEE